MLLYSAEPAIFNKVPLIDLRGLYLLLLPRLYTPWFQFRVCALLWLAYLCLCRQIGIVHQTFGQICRALAGRLSS